MPTPTMQALHTRRKTLLVVLVLSMLVVISLLYAPALNRRLIPRSLRQQMPRLVWMWVDSNLGINGMIGVEPLDNRNYAGVATLGLACFTLSIVAFIGPRPRWRNDIFHIGRPRVAQSAAAAIVIGLLVAGYAAVVLELLGGWSQLAWPNRPIRPFYLGNVILQRTFFITLAIVVPATIAAFFFLHRPARRYDRFIQMIIITYGAFVAGGVLMVIACAIQIYYLGVDTPYQQSGAYTAAGIGLTVMLWTLVPSMVLIWHGEYYRRVVDNLCLACAYNLEGTTRDQCPECGAPIDRAIYAQGDAPRASLRAHRKEH